MDQLFMDRMEGNDEIFDKVMDDAALRKVALSYLAGEIYGRVRGEEKGE